MRTAAMLRGGKVSRNRVLDLPTKFPLIPWLRSGSVNASVAVNILLILFSKEVFHEKINSIFDVSLLCFVERWGCGKAQAYF